MASGRVIVAGLAGVGLLTLAIAWVQRKPIARSRIDNALSEKGVPARYTITAIGTKTQRFANVSLGDPARPDLTADWIEIDTGSYLSGGAVKAVRASGIRLNTRIVGGKLNLGALEKLLPPPTGEPFRLPGIEVSLRKATMLVESDWGRIGIGLSGSGNLAGGFRGVAALVAPRLASGDCAADQIKLTGAVSVVDGRPGFVGPVAAQEMKCQGLTLARPRVQLDASLSQAADGWTGSATGSALRASGKGFSASDIGGKLTVAGNPARSTGTVELTLAALAGPNLTARQSRAAGDFTISQDSSGLGLAAQGTMTSSALRPDSALVARVRRAGQVASGTPVAPIAAQLANAFAGLERGSAAKADWRFDSHVGQNRLNLTGLTAASQSGVRLAASGPKAITFDWPGGLRLDADAQLQGGGLPATRIALSNNGGTAIMAPLSAGGARLSFSPVRFAFGRDLSLDTVATLDGPLGTGRISGLRIPINMHGGSPLSGCHALSFQSLTIASLQLDRTGLPVCIAGNQARIDRPMLAGRLGKTPIRISGDRAQLAFGNSNFSVTSLAVRLAAKDETTRLDAASFSGSLQRGGAAGRFAQLSGKLAGVPLLVSEAQGDWALRQRVLTMGGGLQISDAASEPRYFPLIANDFALRLADNQITANGTARHPKTGIAVSNVSITHDLNSGRGHAILDVPALDFGQALQPEELTPITKGVIALVKGRVTGRGDIDWGPDGVTSTGDFGTQSLDMAAAFGPVNGLSGRIRLSDLLGLATESPQSVKLASINPGIAVLDGEISYRLLPGLKAEILGGSWPFAGGRLSLQPTIMDLSTAATRHLTLKVEGLDAARFIAAMEFENVAATGLFDGELPLIFDQEGGRIEGGRLVARSGGTLSYIGEISNQNVGAMGRFAFDALKSIRYSRLSIDLDGNLGGDVITRIKFAGVSQAPIGGLKPKLPIPIKVRGLTNFPFIFNVTITAKFRQLFDTVRSINDPSILLKREFPNLDLTPVEKDQPVQPSERPPVR